jgi:hypothetical protein
LGWFGNEKGAGGGGRPLYRERPAALVGPNESSVLPCSDHHVFGFVGVNEVGLRGVFIDHTGPLTWRFVFPVETWKYEENGRWKVGLKSGSPKMYSIRL